MVGSSSSDSFSSLLLVRFILSMKGTTIRGHLYHIPNDSITNKVSPQGRRNDMSPADGSSTVAKIASDLRPFADGSAVRTSLVAGGG